MSVRQTPSSGLPQPASLPTTAEISVPSSDRRRLRRRLLAPMGVAAARVRARPGRALLVILGVAAATGMLVGVVGGSLAAQDRTLQRSLASLPDSGRTFRIDSFGLPIGESYAVADRQASSALHSLTPRAPIRAASFRTLIVNGELVKLVGIDGLPRFGHLVSGRWPRECRPARCEIVQAGSGGRPVLDEGGIHLVRVGVVDITDTETFGATLSTASDVAQQEHPHLLLVDGAAAFEHLPAFDGIVRNYAWIAPIDPSRLHIWQVAGILSRESRAQSVVEGEGGTYELTGPDTVLITARQEGHVAAQRMVLIGGEISALLLGFALVAAVGLRRGVSNEARRLLQRGARRAQVWLAVATEVGAMTLVGAVAGLGAGIVAVIAVARVASLPSGAILDRSLLPFAGVAIVLAAWLVATFAIAVAVLMPERRSRRGVRLVDVAAAGAAVAVAIGLTSGKANAEALSGSTSRRLLFTLLPGLVCFIGAVVAGRLLGPVMRVAERRARRGPAALHLAFLVLARAPARTVATVGFLIVSVGLALFAASYRATLQDGARDEAAFAVPLDFTLTEGTQLVLPLDAAPLRRYETLAPGVQADPVLRRTASVAGAGSAVISPTVLGLPAAAVTRLHWRSDFSQLSPATISSRLGADGPATLRGLPIPAGTQALHLTVGVHGVSVELKLVAETAAGRFVTLPLGERTAGSWPLTAHVPAPVRQIVGLQVSLSPAAVHQLAHAAAEGSGALAPSGSATLGPLTATGDGSRRLVSSWSRWVARGGAELGGSTLTYEFTEGQTFLLRLPQETDTEPLPVLVSPDIAAAAAGDTITLDFQDTQVPAKIIGVASRFPDSEQQGEGFVIADESRLQTALDADAPGTGTPDELWLSVSNVAAGHVERELQGLPFSSLVLGSRRDLRAQLDSQPLAHGITLALTTAGLVAILLAAVGFWVTLVSDARDERGELFDLEAQGVRPETLRSQLRARSLVLVGFGALGGVALGLILSRLVVSIVSVSAETTNPEPPLRYQPAWVVALLGLAALVAVVYALTELTSRHALRGETPSKGAWNLE